MSVSCLPYQKDELPLLKCKVYSFDLVIYLSCIFSN